MNAEDHSTEQPAQDSSSPNRLGAIIASGRLALGLNLSLRASAAIAAVSIAAGLLLGIAASNAKQQPGRLEIDLPAVVRTQQQTVDDLQDQVRELNLAFDTLTSVLAPSVNAQAPKPLIRERLVGPGVVVTLSDAPAEFVPDQRTDVNALVVHQQDVDAVLNALWRGGAEGIAVEGIRITSETPVRCIGNVILVGSRSFAPPYQIEAIGDPTALTLSVDSDHAVQLYRRDASLYQLGWDMRVQQSITLPAATDLRTAQFAIPLSET